MLVISPNTEISILSFIFSLNSCVTNYLTSLIYFLNLSKLEVIHNYMIANFILNKKLIEVIFSYPNWLSV